MPFKSAGPISSFIDKCLTHALTISSPFPNSFIKHTPKKYVFFQFQVNPEDGLISLNIYIQRVFLLFKFCDTHLEVSLISMSIYHLEFMSETYKLI